MCRVEMAPWQRHRSQHEQKRELPEDLSALLTIGADAASAAVDPSIHKSWGMAERESV